MTWEILIPNRGRDQPIVDALFDARAVEDPESHAVTRHILDEAAEGKIRTVGEVLSRIEGADPAERRQILDDARQAVGLETTADIAAHQRFKQANEAARRRAAQRPIPTCAVCGTRPAGAGGMHQAVPPARGWHCPDCEHLAAPGDMDPPPQPVDMLFRFIDPDEAVREQREDELRRAEDRRRAEERELRAREAREVARLREEQVRRELFGGRS